MSKKEMIELLEAAKESAKPDMSQGFDTGKLYFNNGFKQGIQYAINIINQYATK